MPLAAKRKRTAKSGGSASKKPRKTRAELNECHQQYYQGVSVLELEGVGCGNHLLGSPNLTFNSPFDGLAWFEIMSGTKGTGTGCIRLCTVSKRRKEYDVLAPTFVVPMRHVEQFIIIDEPRSEDSTASEDEVYRVIIVPTAAVGASALKRTYPQAISFTLPDRKAGSDFKGQIGEATVDPDETYRSLITRVFNEQLAPYKKTVIDVTSAADVAAAKDESEARISCVAILKPREDEDAKEDVKGQLFFLKTGILFHAQTTALYLTAKSTQDAMLIHNFEGTQSKEPINVSLICPTSEPYYERDQESRQGTSEQNRSSEPLLISFHGIDGEMSSSIAQHAERYGIELSELEQQWYSLEENQPMSGWMPLGFRDMMPPSRGRNS